MGDNVSAQSSAPVLSALFLTYNRVDLLAEAIASLRVALSAMTVETEVVVSDDASTGEHAAQLAALDADCLVSAKTNRGLGHNHNQGLRACRSDAILSIQDDWRFVGRRADLEAALAILAWDGEVGLVNLMPPPQPLPGEQRALPGGATYWVFDNDGQRRVRPCGARPYSDRPHLKRRAFVADLGPYREDLPMTRSELDFQRRVAEQRRWRVAWLTGARAFDHLGAERSFNPGSPLGRRMDKAVALPVVGPALQWARAGAKSVLRAAGLREDA